MTVSLARVIISVNDLDTSLAFYELLGLTRAYVSAPIASLRAGDLEVMLHERPATGSDAAVALSIAVEDVDRLTDAAAAAGAQVIDPPADQPWGERQSVIRDPNGHVLCLVRKL